MKDIVIVGSSGFAKEILWIIERQNDINEEWNFLGYIDNQNDNNRIIGNDDFLLNYNKELYVVIAIANTKIRRGLSDLYKKNSKLKFPNIIDPSVLMSNSIKLNEGNIICAGNILTVDVKLGNFNIINLNCTIGHEATIDSFVTLNPNVNVSGNVHLADGVNIGTGAQIIQGKQINKDATIGAGAVVINDIEEKCTAVGIPARIIHK